MGFSDKITNVDIWRSLCLEGYLRGETITEPSEG